MNRKKHINKQNSFSIIAGEYGGRKLPFAGDDTLRPTPNRIRETLFNWLQFSLKNKTVLDCFAGSGALGFEALSRGAARVVLFEKNPQTSSQLTKNIQLLQNQHIELVPKDIFASNISEVFDVVFLDPPFGNKLIPSTLLFLREQGAIDEHTIIYLESECPVTTEHVAFPIEILKQKKAASVYYHLIKIAV